MKMSKLFSHFSLRGLEFKNRIFVSPMCQYSAKNGMAETWHLVHLGSRAVGGAGLVMVEATAVLPEGRISPYDLGLWSDHHAEALAPVAHFIREQGAIPAIQLAHAGRKASTDAPWLSRSPLYPDNGGWQVVAPSAIAFSAGSPQPRELTPGELDELVVAFVAAAKRALIAGFKVVEIHMAHGYLLHQFLSPLSNQRNDIYGGNLENRARLPLQVARAVREVWPQNLPLFARISATDWVGGGWDLAQSLQLCRWLKEAGIDLIDCSSGGLTADAKIPAGPGFQTPYAAAIRQDSGIAVGAVGLITSPEQAEQIIATGQAEVVFLARELLRDPYWPLHAARKLGVDIRWPSQYDRAKPA
jgi:2,4-dienoyl-CoA reductase-like NADH-dependent reductase (Old Yellow Enzyme family)